MTVMRSETIDVTSDLDGNSLSTAIDRLQLILDHHPDAIVDIDTESDPYSHNQYARLHIRYMRPETKTERRERIAKTNAIKAEQAEKRRQQYEALKKEFEP